MRSVAVVGAGPAGLAATKELLAEGFDVICFERTDALGGIFRYRELPGEPGVWKTCRLTSSQLVTSFSDFFTEREGKLYEHRHLDHAEYVTYLEKYAEHFGVLPRIRFEQEVSGVRRVAGGGWAVITRDSATGATRNSRFDAVVVCSGLHRVPSVPDIPGLDEFSGEVLHSAHYRGPDSIRGRSAVFVGVGESGGDIVGEASRALDHAYVSIRRRPFVIPRLLFELPNDYTSTRLLYSLPEVRARRTDLAATTLARKVDALLFPIALLGRAVDRLQRRIQGPSHRLRPAVAELIERFRDQAGGNQFETFATKTEGFLEAVVDGRCELKPAVRQVTPDGVVFEDGTCARVDAIVFCTGFEPAGAPFLAEQVRLDRLYRSCFAPEVGSSLAFVGFVRPPIGAIPPMAEMQARYVARVLAGRLALPAPAEMTRHTEEAVRGRAAYHAAVFGRIPHLMDYSTYMESLAEEIGCKPCMRDLWRSPLLLFRLYAVPYCASQYRLVGPGATPALARRVLLEAPVMARYAMFLDLAVATAARMVNYRPYEPRLTTLGRHSPSPYELVR
jgi:dimethylaniline monooxygenase (N-oxide forming)